MLVIELLFHHGAGEHLLADLHLEGRPRLMTSLGRMILRNWDARKIEAPSRLSSRKARGCRAGKKLNTPGTSIMTSEKTKRKTVPRESILRTKTEMAAEAQASPTAWREVKKQESRITQLERRMKSSAQHSST